MTIQLLQGDCLEVLATLDANSIQTVITSPPYWGLRKYSDDPREIGQEAAPDCLAWARSEPPCSSCFVCALRAVFAGVWRVLRDDGTVWVNLGDTMAAGKSGRSDGGRESDTFHGQPYHGEMAPQQRKPPPGLKPKDLIMIPARVALALQSDGWIVRSDVIWSKPNCMPESVTDRPTRAHEYVFLLSKQGRYFYDATAIAEPIQQSSIDRINQPTFDQQNGGPKDYGTTGVNTSRSMRKTLENFKTSSASGTRNKRSVWVISTKSYSGAHFATMPEALIEPCLLASSSARACEQCGAAWGRVVERDGECTPARKGGPKTTAGIYSDPDRAGGFYPDAPRDLGFAPRCACALNTGAASSTVLDPFAGTGTVLRVAERFGRDAIGIELNPDYEELSDARTNGVQKELFR